MNFFFFLKYSKIPVLRPPLGLSKTGPINGVALFLNIKLLGRSYLGLAKTGPINGVALFLNMKLLGRSYLGLAKTALTSEVV